MKYIATFDIGTTAIKGILVTQDLKIIHAESIELTTLFTERHKEQDPQQWYDSFCTIAKQFTKLVNPAEIMGIVMSGQMQNLILLRKDGYPLQNAILYSDARATSQVESLNTILGDGTVQRITGNPFDASIPFAKLLWLKENMPDMLEKTHKIVISSKDTVIARLCGEFVTDVTTASTSGLMDIESRTWRADWLEMIGVSSGLLPRLCVAHEEVGSVLNVASAETGFEVGTAVYAGVGDAGAATLAGCVSKPGEYNINLGTSGWVATMSQNTQKQEGVFNLVAISADCLINVVPFFNAGNVHKWICSILAPDDRQTEKYEYGNTLLNAGTCGSHGLFCLPYFVGERFPVVDEAIKGAYIGITPETTKQDIIRATLEGVAFAIRQGIESLSYTPVSISLIGGGAKVNVWCQLLSEVLATPLDVYPDTEIAPSLAIATSVLITKNIIKGYDEFINLRKSNCVSYTPVQQNVEHYQRAYEEYLRIYPAIKTLYR